jgi:hypothetical protein
MYSIAGSFQIRALGATPARIVLQGEYQLHSLRAIFPAIAKGIKRSRDQPISGVGRYGATVVYSVEGGRQAQDGRPDIQVVQIKSCRGRYW